MKICHINLGDTARFGGTAVAATRLNRALQQAGVESQMLCGYLDQAAPDVRERSDFCVNPGYENEKSGVSA